MTSALSGEHPQPPTPVELEIQAAEQMLGGFAKFAVHATARCVVHGVVQRRVPGRSVYRCPACMPASFGSR